MSKHYEDYFWKDGLPVGMHAQPKAGPGVSYKIPSDPYHKYVSIEKYLDGSFLELVYDSSLFNFRHLNATNLLSWQKTLMSEQQEQAICHIRDQNDRLILIEEYRFKEGICRECLAYSPSRILISIQKMFYTKYQDAFNGLILYDTHAHAVMSKKYEWDSKSESFSSLIEETWNMKGHTL